MKRPHTKPGPLKPAAIKLVQIEKPVYGGSFLARDEGKTIFVPLALPGEQARIRIMEEKRSFAIAELEEVVTAAPQRVAPGCRHFGLCGGCHYQHTDYETQLRLKQSILQETLERGGVRTPADIEVLAAAPWAYRNRVRLAFDRAGHVGYRERRSHEVIPISECPIAAPLLIKAAIAAAEVLHRSAPGLRPTELALFCNGDETALLVSVFVTGDHKHQIDRIAAALNERVPELCGAEFLAGVRVGQAPGRIAQWGKPSLSYRVGQFDYRVDLSAFFQVNRWLVDSLVERVTARHKGRLAWDLFAGVGLFARRLASQFERVVAVESAPTAIAALEQNLSGTASIGVIADTLGFLRRNNGRERPDLIVVDPPRTGLGAEITTLLATIGPQSLTYVSCDPATMARDLRALIQSGYEIDSVALADLFPQTFHLETVVHMRQS